MRISGVVERSGYRVPGEVSYLYGVSRVGEPSVPPAWPNRVPVPGNKDMDVVYQYRVLEGWQGDIPVSMTYLVARRSYEEVEMLFKDYPYGKGQFRQWLA
ncbi:hypothetical protein TheveDRAFT_1194 [Thermanaerovibrio velox DSM 12556]|uniref:Uncharacterized protein n=1 Tax=Thermanaerovibrio velox DSM 12556 TaxID=926567 RepID=H0USM8_9BACT|nr:hypothetical protein [Thermanaerovibrio velox]EHM10317.1 hypothetical protein TheveDRAFT_1194 [Thermanaerovibrio velox DSM 12556]